MKALVVDDSRAIRSILTKMLRNLGFDTFEAGDGVEALRRLAEIGEPRLMLVDWNMPEMNGLELIRAVRRDCAFRDVAVVMVTTESEYDQVVRALAAGANEYVMKPFTPDAIVEKLEMLGVAAV
jgi:two-component system chemotaxis response regulator CheY